MRRRCSGWATAAAASVAKITPTVQIETERTSWAAASVIASAIHSSQPVVGAHDHPSGDPESEQRKEHREGLRVEHRGGLQYDGAADEERQR